MEPSNPQCGLIKYTGPPTPLGGDKPGIALNVCCVLLAFAVQHNSGCNAQQADAVRRAPEPHSSPAHLYAALPAGGQGNGYDKCTTSEAVTCMSLAAVDDLPGQVGGGEYLPTEDTTTDDSVWGRLTPEADDGVELTEYTKNGLTIQLAAQNTGDTEASIRLPLFYYPGYHMTAADGAALTHKNGYLTVTLAPGWQGSVQVRWTGMPPT